MRITLSAIIVLGFVLVGCGTSNLPRGARLVGGGLMIEYEAPSPGTAVLLERESSRVVATQSLDEGDVFEFGPNHDNYGEVLFRMFPTTNIIEGTDIMAVPANTWFQLYFVPTKAKKE